MARLLVSKEDLARILTERMQQLQGGEGCSVESVIRLTTPSEDGCNWVPGPIPVRCRAVLQKAYAKARHEFNLDLE